MYFYLKYDTLTCPTVIPERVFCLGFVPSPFVGVVMFCGLKSKAHKSSKPYCCQGRKKKVSMIVRVKLICTASFHQPDRGCLALMVCLVSLGIKTLSSETVKWSVSFPEVIPHSKVHFPPLSKFPFETELLVRDLRSESQTAQLFSLLAKNKGKQKSCPPPLK